MLPLYRERISSYSFGANNAPDILIPKEIARTENISYTPYILDQKYMEKEYLQNAIDTIMLSSGTRNLKRTHYLYSIKNLINHSDILLTGIWGDEIFKVGKPKGGSVLSTEALNLILNDFNTIQLNDLLDDIDMIFPNRSKEIIDELRTRIGQVYKKYIGFETNSEKLYAFRFQINLRKYFGNEMNSYNDFVRTYTPFIDIDFLKDFAKTEYWGARHSVEKTHLGSKSGVPFYIIIWLKRIINHWYIIIHQEVFQCMMQQIC